MEKEMTYEKAIDVLENSRVMMIKGSAEDLRIASDMAVKAMRKQVKMEPQNHNNEKVCKVCGSGLFRNDEYCWKCGQAVNRGE